LVAGKPRTEKIAGALVTLPITLTAAWQYS
jgi:hypothetical protein